jgi:[protein-PII] uridylyltransferase
VLALHRLDVRSASVFSRGATAVTVFRVEPRFGALPDWAVVQATCAGRWRRAGPAAVLASREAAYARGRLPRRPSVRCSTTPPTPRRSSRCGRADALGVLHRITGR